MATESFSTGDQIILSGFGSTYSYLNGQSAEVIATGLTTTTFELQGLTGAGSLTAGNTYTAAGVATQDTTFNPGVVNLAMLGVCPSSGSFSTGGTLFNGSTFTPLQYVYVNEVSTVAAAYAMAGFGTDGLHIGTDTSASPTLTAPGIVGIQNAAMNAGNLYDIQGKYLTTGTPVGEGHIANPTTFNGSQNGTVPQAELDTLGNILAACVDSNNTSASTSPACTTLFSGASSNGGNTGGTNAVNTAQAAFNIAHYPMTSAVVGLYTLPSAFPFQPKLSAAPNDFTVGIIYSSTANATSGASATTSIASPTAVAIDSYGNAYVSATTSSSASTITKLSALGTSLATSTGATGATVPGYMDFLAIDQSGNVWATTTGTSVGSQSGNGSLLKFNNGLTTVSVINSGMYAPSSIAIDSSNNVFVSNYNTLSGNVGFFSEFVGGGTTQTQIDSSCGGRASSVTVNTFGGHEYMWTTTNSSNLACIVPVTTGTAQTDNNGLSNTYNISLDSNGYGWFSNHGQTNIFKLSSSGTTTAEGKDPNNQNNQIAGLYDPAWTAIDGANNIFIVNDNGTNSSVSELSNTAKALSCPTCSTQNSTPYFGYQPGNVSSVTGATVNGLYVGNIVVDPSGDVWVANYSGNTILEIVGVGTPVVTPLSSQQYGIKP